MKKVVWTDYFRYKADLRGFDLQVVEDIIRYSQERYYDIVTGRLVVIGKDTQIMVIIPYDEDEAEITPVTVHATSRQQVNHRVNTGRFIL